MELFDSLGILGFILYLVSYALLQARKILGDSISYIMLNLTAATLVLVSLTNHFNIASALIQISWIVISLYGLFYNLYGDRSTRGIWFFDKRTKPPALKIRKTKKTLAVCSMGAVGMMLAAGLAAIYMSNQVPTSETISVTDKTNAASLSPVTVTHPASGQQPDSERPANNQNYSNNLISTLLTRAQNDLKLLIRNQSTEVNPWPLYKQVLSLDPENPGARSGQRQLFATYVKLAKQASTYGNETLSVEFYAKQNKYCLDWPMTLRSSS